MVFYPFMIPLVVWVMMQIVKICIDYYKTKSISHHSVRIAWWFPSVHSWLSSSVMALVWLQEWLASPLFVIASIFSLLFRYDAMNVRYEAGKHARQINSMSRELQWVLDNKDDQKKITRRNKDHILSERIGHTPFEVVWWVVMWVCLTMLIYYLIY